MLSKYIYKINIRNRMNVIVYLVACFIVLLTILMWYSSSKFEESNANIRKCNDLVVEVWQMRSTYNSLRGDIMQLFVADPLEHKKLTEDTYLLISERFAMVESSEQKIASFGKLPDHVQAPYAVFHNSLDKYVSICKMNLDTIGTVSVDNIVSFKKARNLLAGEFNTCFMELRHNAINAIAAAEQERNSTTERLDAERKTLMYYILLFSVVLLALTFLLIKYISDTIVYPVNKARKTLENLSEGELPDVETHNGNDEIAHMVHSLNHLSGHMKNLMDFAGNVAQSKFETRATMFGGKGPIAGAMINMRDSLKTAAENEAIRNWKIQGLAHMSALFRNKDSGTDNMTFDLIKFLVSYMGMNQGALYVVNSDDKNEPIGLDMASFIAYDRRKYQQKHLEWGEGLVGAACFEKDIVYLTEVPGDYVEISGGLGAARPRCIVIAPLISDNKVVAAIEMASFTALEPHKLEFLKEASAIIAAEVVSYQINGRMQTLLEQAQQQTEEMRAQEEEMRQNMEELHATQEEMNRKTLEMEQTIINLTDKLNHRKLPDDSYGSMIAQG